MITLSSRRECCAPNLNFSIIKLRSVKLYSIVQPGTVFVPEFVYYFFITCLFINLFIYLFIYFLIDSVNYLLFIYLFISYLFLIYFFFINTHYREPFRLSSSRIHYSDQRFNPQVLTTFYNTSLSM